ncbi:uncharacterized protein BXZ73DRAFT_73853 [Epithele typhae]|uniref:uncharacterized protein n=1 Tax=Epithele typhae TaxID=378194 RepID=UPI00200835C9|nr:uncharacterized protein BXZ73DRAFT_73853 [Epithele typhae]KAH9944303.1 hypothetical protein BXZ73DRAFT_73853 [Epithele typhae]
MSDPRFARLKTDPRFRRVKKDKHRVVVDDRFKAILNPDRKGKRSISKAPVDKYGRALPPTHEQDNLRRFYRLEDDDEARLDLPSAPDYARGDILLESSDEEGEPAQRAESDDDSDSGGVVTLGRDITQPIPVPGDSAEVDLDEDTLADLDAQAAEYAKANPEDAQGSGGIQHTRRIAAVNLDWDHVRAIHLYKICSSLVSPTGAAATSGSKGSSKRGSTSAVRGRVLSVRVYTSEFGKQRMAREEKEGPPPEVFKKKRDLKPEEVNERTVYEFGDEEDYDEDALRNYQLERLRYFYAIIECDSVEAASHIFDELEGTELERSANVFDLSFVPDGMTFKDSPRDEATEDVNAPYKPLEFTTDALRHSKVKLTWDEDEPERAQVTRRTFTKKEIEENDFRAYIASSSDSDSDNTPAAVKGKAKNNKTKDAGRDRLRALLLGEGDETLPEGWAKGEDDTGADDIDMEITFTPGLSTSKDGDETTLEKYQREMREKKKKRKEEMRGRAGSSKTEPKTLKKAEGLEDDFFGADSEDGSVEAGVSQEEKGKSTDRKGKRPGGEDKNGDQRARVESTAEELALLAASDNPNREIKHFDMKAVLRAEKKGKKKGKKGKRGIDEGENEVQEDFSIDVKDERFKAVLEDHTFAIDPSNPRFKKTKSMAVLLEERSRRQQNKSKNGRQSTQTAHADGGTSRSSLQSLVESVKRKSVTLDAPGVGKRRKLA